MRNEDRGNEPEHGQEYKDAHWRTFKIIVVGTTIGAAFAHVLYHYVLKRILASNRSLPPDSAGRDAAKTSGGVGRGIGKDVGREAGGEVGDKDMPDQPPPPPETMHFAFDTLDMVSFAPGQDTTQHEALWTMLQQEGFRQCGEGYRTNWAFHLHAAANDLGVPLAPTASANQRISHQGKQYGFQVFARDTLFNEIPKWSDVQSLNNALQGGIPDEGAARTLLDATYQLVGTTFHVEWATHQFAVKHRLGPALSEAYRITVDGQEYSLQVFAADTLYAAVPNWSDVRRLSETAAGALREALLAETYRVADTPYDSTNPFAQLAAEKNLGTPLSDIYPVDLNGAPFTVQVFAGGVVYAGEDGVTRFQHDLVKPSPPESKPEEGSSVSPILPGDTVSSPDHALSNKRPSFAMLPVAGQPRISQFYGYTKWSAGEGRKYYGACQGKHPGIDFAVAVGTQLLAIDYGVVMCAGRPNQECPFGGSPPMLAIVRYGSIYAIYGHASAVRVEKGQRVEPGQVVCLSGDYGGPHLHFEIRPVPDRILNNTDPNQPAVNPGNAINPIDFFNAKLNRYFDAQLQNLGGNSHFCRGSLRDQTPIQFAGAVETRPCTQ